MNIFINRPVLKSVKIRTMKKFKFIPTSVLLFFVFALLFSSCAKDEVAPSETNSNEVEQIIPTVEHFEAWELLSPQELSSFNPEEVSSFLETLSIRDVYEYTYNYEVANFFEENNIETKEFFYGMSHKAIKGLPFQELLSESQWDELQEKIIENDCDIQNNVNSIYVWVYKGVWMRIEVENSFSNLN
jgi:hypothetical protein